MLTVGPSVRVYLASQSVDLRRGHDGLCALVRSSLRLDLFDDCVFVFLGFTGVSQGAACCGSVGVLADKPPGSEPRYNALEFR